MLRRVELATFRRRLVPSTSNLSINSHPNKFGIISSLIFGKTKFACNIQVWADCTIPLLTDSAVINRRVSKVVRVAGGVARTRPSNV
jgi:hypothetical protein